MAALSAGTYTLPFGSDTANQMLLVPFGVGDLAAHDGGHPFDASRFDSVPVWIGVGGNRANVADVPSEQHVGLGATGGGQHIGNGALRRGPLANQAC